MTANPHEAHGTAAGTDRASEQAESATSYHTTDDGAMTTAVFHEMTIPFTLRVLRGDEATIREQTANIRAFMRYIDRTFSPFRHDSSTSKANAGDWSALLKNPDFYEVYARSIAAKDATEGHFRTRRNGAYDPVGIVKGWAIERAFTRFIAPLLGEQGAEAAVLGGGGDMQMGVREGSAFAWRVGIEHPTKPGMLAGTVAIASGGIATSGVSKRGEHIDHIGPRASHDVIQATVVGDRLTTADVWATTAVAAGSLRFRELSAGQPLNSLLIDEAGNSHAIPATVNGRHTKG